MKSVQAIAQESPCCAPVVQTTEGAVRGYTEGGVSIFKGIPYGASTAGANRFMPPQKPTPWGGIRDTTRCGHMAMQPIIGRERMAAMMTTATGRLSEGFLPPPPWSVSEDCLVLNVWTPASRKGVRRPVMVWLHGGGFGVGAANWGPTDGMRVARKNDVVVVSLNHRLNLFGFLYLAEFGDGRYASSGNAGMLDIVAALQWVRDNIASFGGDPDNVTVFGQSGGGCKVNVLMAMPSAQGLFHKAIQMSGPCPRMLTREQALKATEKVLNLLKLSPRAVDQLPQIPAKRLLEAMSAAYESADLNGYDDSWRDGTWLHMFDPVVDGTSLPRHPFDPTAPEISADIPMLLGTCDEDSRVDAGLRPPLSFPVGELNEKGMRENLKGLGLGSIEAERLIREFRATRPFASATDVFSAIASELEYRRDVITMAERKCTLSRVSVYMYLFTWKSPALGGKYKSSHGFELPFVFDNVDLSPGLWGPDPDPRRYELAERMSGAWAAFARTGNPNHAGLPQWKPYSLEERGTMVLDYGCEWVKDPRRDDRLATYRVELAG